MVSGGKGSLRGIFKKAGMEMATAFRNAQALGPQPTGAAPAG